MPPIGSCLWAGNIIDFLKHLSSYLFTKFSSHVMRTFRTYSLSNFYIYNRVLLTVVTILYITITSLFKWEFSIWFSGTFLKLLIFILLSDFGILVFFSVNSQKHYSQEPICSVKLGQYLRSHRVEFSLRESKLIQSEGQQRKILRHYKPCPNFPPCHSQAFLLWVSLPQSLQQQCCSTEEIFWYSHEFFRDNKTFCQLFSWCSTWLGWYTQTL